MRDGEGKTMVVDSLTSSDNEMRDHLQALCDDLKKTHGVEVRPGNNTDKWEICLRCKVTGSIAAAHAKALRIARIAEQIGLVSNAG
jgi:hypothetical protein